MLNYEQRKRFTYDQEYGFSVRIVNLYKWLCNEKKEFVLSKQLLRSGTSIGANLSEAQSAISKADFAAKVYISLKESKETLYWIELLYRTKYLDEKLYLSIYKDANEMVSLLASVTKKLQPDSH